MSATDFPQDSGGQIYLSWTPSISAGVTEQRVLWSLSAGGPYSLLTTINDNTTAFFTDDTTTDGVQTYYVVRAWNGAQESGNSNEAASASYPGDDQHNWGWGHDLPADPLFPSYPAKSVLFSGNEIVAHIKSGGSGDYDPIVRIRMHINMGTAFGANTPISMLYRDCTAAGAGGAACDALYGLPMIGFEQVATQNGTYTQAGDPLFRFHESTLVTNGAVLPVLSGDVEGLGLELLAEHNNNAVAGCHVEGTAVLAEAPCDLTVTGQMEFDY